MKSLPEIDPEVRGLLEEIVADPRSSIRFAPRKPLKSWFDREETLNAREYSWTKAERHLVEAHREALAALFCEGAWIAYWKSPILAHRPNSDGIPQDPVALEPSWRVKARRRHERASLPDVVAVLGQCMSELRPEQALPLARASLALVPTDRARFYVASATPWTQPRTAIARLSRLCVSGGVRWRPYVLGSIGARLCAIDQIHEARSTYLQVTRLRPESVSARFSVFNLSCIIGDGSMAMQEGKELAKLHSGSSWRVLEARDLLRRWLPTRGAGDLQIARSTARQIRSSIPEFVHPLLEAYES